MTYTLRTVTYGTAAAQFLAMRVLRQLDNNEGHHFPRGQSISRAHFYVDDVLFGADSVSETIEIREELIALLGKGGFALGKWAASDLSTLSKSEQVKDSCGISNEDAPLHSVLELQWYPGEDSFSFHVEAPSL